MNKQHSIKCGVTDKHKERAKDPQHRHMNMEIIILDEEYCVVPDKADSKLSNESQMSFMC